MSDHTGKSYEAIADSYAAKVDASPMNALYERPAVLALLPPLAGTHVLDIGCGSGWYAEYLLSHGATVTSFDLDATFVELTRTRVGERATVLRANLAEPLAFAQSGEFDLAVAPLVLHYLRDWTRPLREIYRVLRPGGALVFSTHHPFMDWQEFKREDYFALDLLEDYWQGVGAVQFYRRPLTAISATLIEAGFVIERLVEPQPSPPFREARPELFERLMRQPWFLVVKARKLGP
ncbi:MAG: class I SAM-dependent methyltransferase [Chloroflexi bacterium OHK40]